MDLRELSISADIPKGRFEAMGKFERIVPLIP